MQSNVLDLNNSPLFSELLVPGGKPSFTFEYTESMAENLAFNREHTRLRTNP